jgi:flagellar assembly protein FliH
MAPSVVSWQPRELRAAGDTAVATETAWHLFEVAGSAAVPDDLLAEARAAAHAAGYTAGWASGIRAAQAEAAVEALRCRVEADQLLAEQRAEVQRCIAGLDAAAASLEQQSLPTVQQLETLLLESAFAVAEALVGHALRDDAVRAPAALARVLALAPAGEPLTVRVSPADHAVLTASGEPDPVSSRPITLVADPALAAGDAVATTGATEIDARLRAGLARVREALAP